ncbi:MAG: TlpA disulfide reductase family protein [Gammaproteobacteria bacterium]|nr:TlpA disulfide reductase family protein [Gammaproteobacteria bacterium]MDE0413468.1 TlpA disulfide reductase family protein [Gammaproteobacteria bacterium]
MSHFKHNLRTRFVPLLLLVLPAGPTFAEEAPVMVLEGTTAAPYDNGDFTVFDSTRVWDPTTFEVWKKTAAPGERPPLEAQGVIAQARIGPDATFRLEIPVDQPRTLFFAVLNAVGPNGERWGPVKMGNNFILEPGELKLRMIRSNYSVITGGHYNDAVFNSWRMTEEYEAAYENYVQYLESAEDESEQDRRRRVDNLVEAQGKALKLEAQGMAKVALEHPDPFTRRLAIEASWQFGPWLYSALRGIAELTPDDPWVIERLAAMEAAAANANQYRQPAVGESILDFTAETLDGEEVTLADLRADSRYLLVEFWASWCGPCRVEIPHMKQAYARFRDKGFEIVSFTVDEEREDWEEASAEEDLPWFDLGMGYEAEAAKAYNVLGVPNNYLVESSTGKIISKDLRQHKLDEKLEELLE